MVSKFQTVVNQLGHNHEGSKDEAEHLEPNRGLKNGVRTSSIVIHIKKLAAKIDSTFRGWKKNCWKMRFWSWIRACPPSDC